MCSITDFIGLKSIFETDFKRHSEPRLTSTAQINH
ncbi:benzoate transporter [Pediococcus acidilactici]|nr:benzoate transporter [Pediococcus acidilactici]KAF0351311.1 benzoate transporter [Pediococcus acidilactici]KAF0354924.1 benzoate transporter [Pediococcus acidilactici]KAF0374304.1 benzoate transporter [Pediococcus acidilactici]KAF0396306.1 benzoate transporter [Pediococcus acidilactici]